MTIEDVIKKSILPLAFMLFWFWMVSTIMKVSGQTDLFWWIFLSGLPFGIHKMRLILIPKGMDITATLGMAALSVIIGALDGIILDIGAGTGKTTIEMANMICDKEIIALEPSAYMRTAFMARLMEHNEVKERISLLPIDVGKYSFRDKISGVMCMGVLGHLKRDEQEKLLYKLDKNLNINVPILIELLEPKFLVAPVGSRISVATQGRLRYETYITDIKQVGMDQWTWRLTYKVFCGKNIVSTVDSLMSWNYQSVEKILNQLTKMHFRTAKLSETLLLAIKAR